MPKLGKLIRLMTDAEMAFFIDLREVKGDKAAAKYVSSLDLYEKIEDDIKESKKACK